MHSTWTQVQAPARSAPLSEAHFCALRRVVCGPACVDPAPSKILEKAPLQAFIFGVNEGSRPAYAPQGEQI